MMYFKFSVCVFITIILTIYFLFFFNNKIEHFKYHKCDNIKVGTILNDVFKTNNINKTYNNKWDIYLPCGYNYVEKELTEINPISNKQIIFGISGCDSIVSKNKLWESLNKYYGRKTAKRIMPETWILNDKQEMNLFIKQYDNKQMYILKKNVQRKEGLKLTKNLQEIMDGKLENYKVVQKYNTNLFLINNRKVNLRIYLLIVCQKGVVNAYLHKNGKCIYTNKEYNDNVFDFESNITSYHLDMEVYKKNPFSFKELSVFLKKKKKNPDLLFKRINHIIYLTILSVKHNLCNLKNIYHNKTFQLFGLDVIFDNNMNPYLLEFNKGPDMIPRNNIDNKMKFKVEEDIFNILQIVNYNKKNQQNGFYKIY